MDRLLKTGLNTGIQDAPRIIDGEGVYFVMSDGRKLIDGSCTGGPLGHRHPDIITAMQDAITRAPVVSEGWFWAEREAAAEELIKTAFARETDWIGAVRFFLSGSEANDAALSLAQALTGRTRIATRERAYHGLAGLSRAATTQPQWHGGISWYGGGVSPVPVLTKTTELPAPYSTRNSGRIHYLRSRESLEEAEAQLSDCAAMIIDYSQGGIYHDPAYQDRAAQAARKAGALWIADEVVTGLGRSGHWFAFDHGTTRPDMVTLGKSLAGGAAPCGAVVLSKAIVERISKGSWQNYSTFRGHPLMIAATRTYLRVVERDGLLDRVRDMEKIIQTRLAAIARKHDIVARIDGRGIHWTVELKGGDWRDWRADTSETPPASLVSDRAIEAGALIGTSGEHDSLFLAPALTMSDTELERLLDALDYGLEALR
ncbi:aminotransferase class III-fold pyridoxal phosphate-dependent enzyme [Martelella alba]|uniref:Aminotransferase class III-fold pyridoxal phosphate-dependent enzyme n=1 Tax=Martelella alba TaxID=2590451 RepID=A0ABY2SNI2_9HYPH|nr:aminotransferase class III-fold pyridoxal phosphate-dependent enzyme [Martelella alba]TKI05281.1 aminotransferase class III-fold pyridoxal phosphate-dependent enzyme [Martelella alba]